MSDDELNPYSAEAQARQSETYGITISGPDGVISDEALGQLKLVADHLEMGMAEYVGWLAALGASDHIGGKIRDEIRDRQAQARVQEMVVELVDYAAEVDYIRYGDGQGGCLLQALERELKRRYSSPRTRSTTPKRAAISAAQRKRVMEHDEYRCIRCSTHEDLCIDHVLAVARGGTNDEANLQTLCQPCNSEKGTRTMEEWLGADWAEQVTR